MITWHGFPSDDQIRANSRWLRLRKETGTISPVVLVFIGEDLVDDTGDGPPLTLRSTSRSAASFAHYEFDHWAPDERIPVNEEGKKPLKLKPSGHENRQAKKKREEAERLIEAERIKLGLQPPKFAPLVCEDFRQVHLLQLQRLWEAQEMLVADSTLGIAEKVRCIQATANAMAKLNVQAQVEIQRKQLMVAVARKEDELRLALAETEKERHALHQQRQKLEEATSAALGQGINNVR